MPKFSIVVPVYNVEPYLRECLNSVVEQTDPDWECVCVDDGSLDASGVLLDSSARSDARIRVCHQRNAGVSAARNRALERIVGEWLLFLDSDDVWHKQLLEIVDSETGKADLICFRSEHGDGSVVASFSQGDVSRPSVTTADWGDALPIQAFGLAFWQCACKKSIVDASARFDTRFAYGEDRLWHFHVLTRCAQVTMVDAVLHLYRVRAGSAMQQGTVSAKRIRSELGYSCEILRHLAACRKSVAPRAVHEFMALVTERSVGWIVALPQLERKAMWDEWFRRLHALVLPPKTGIWFSVVVRILRCCPFRWLAVGLCYIPQWLKQHGVHR